MAAKAASEREARGRERQAAGRQQQHGWLERSTRGPLCVYRLQAGQQHCYHTPKTRGVLSVCMNFYALHPPTPHPPTLIAAAAQRNTNTATSLSAAIALLGSQLWCVSHTYGVRATGPNSYFMLSRKLLIGRIWVEYGLVE